jgi:predicted nucleic acid-binding protein
MNIYLDTNILLSFYHLTSEDLEELKKLVALLKQKKAQLLLPEQTRDEFYRNRAGKIADAIKKLREQTLNLQFPAMCKDYAPYDELRKLQKAYEKLHAELLEKLQKDIDAAKLKADTLTSELFSLATVIASTDDLVDSARLRFDVGNPPGKNNSLGDAINWLALLKATKEKEDLHFIGGDKDYRSALDDDRFNEFLLREWIDTKKSNIAFYRVLSAFFKEKFPEIKLASELEKETLIASLATSGTFARTHFLVAQLAKNPEFTAAQANNIIQAATSNNQVLWIANDADVNDFLVSVIAKHEAAIDADKLAELRPHLKKDEPAG